jgi:putative ABC transport system permease protein
MRSGLFRVVELGVRSLMLHRLRSMLTTLGVLFGTSSVIAMLAIGEGASEEAQEQIRQLGSQNVILRSVKPPEDPNVGNQRTRVVVYGLTDEDLRRIRETFPGLAGIVPLRELAQEVRRLDRVTSPRVIAAPPEYHRISGRMLHSGRFLSEADELHVANVTVLGFEVARQLFPLEDPLGETVRIGSDYFTVVGVLLPRVAQPSEGSQAGVDTASEVFIPFVTGRKRYGDLQVRMRAGSQDMEQVQLSEIILAVEHPHDVEFVAEASRRMLAHFHRQRDYAVIVPLELLAKAAETKRIFNIVLGSIAGISLLVGGIGIMNVMLATVTERTREIGIRRALGAKRRHIVTQFLVETVVLSVGGGAMGVLLGLAIPIVVEHYADMRTVVTPLAPTLAFSISALTGVVFGLYPAWRAARMDPVEALRHE